MKTALLSILLVQAILVSSAFGKKNAIDSVRSAKLKQVANALAAANEDTLRAALSSTHQIMSKEEASVLFRTISQAWGELSKLEELGEDEDQPISDKGNMRIVAHWGKEPTQDGKWMLFRIANGNNTYLRIGLLFGKGDGHAGQFLACEFPAPEHRTPNKPGGR